jgi:hypothetical protein
LVGSNRRKPPPFPLVAAPVVDKLVSSDSDQPSDRHRRRVRPAERRNRGHKRLSGQVLGIGNAAAAWQQIAVHLGKGSAVSLFVDIRSSRQTGQIRTSP